MRKIRGYIKSMINKRYTSNNLGLHCHCAETKEKLLELLKKAKEENVKVLTVNNYKSLKVYTQVLPQLSDKDLQAYKDMRIVPSIEMPASFNYTNLDGQNYNIEVHILGYGVDIEKEELLQQFCNKEYKSINQEEELQRLIKIGHEIGLTFNDEEAYLDSEDDNRKFAGRAFVQALMRNMDENFCQEGEENKNKLPFELRTNWRAFQNRCVKDLNNPFYLDVASLNPDVSEVISLIHEMGGKAYLAHPSSYFAKVGTKTDIDKAFRNVVKFAEDFIKAYSPRNNSETHIDATEVYHPSYLGNIEVTSEIKEIVKQHRIGSSGGTDIHVDKTLDSSETVSSDSFGGNVTRNKLRKFRNLRRKSIEISKLRRKVIDTINRGEER
ncbi:MAG: hypothetical protein HFJ59_02460 [Clostridia bacterium]|nr:hypothetical protein [Clostridia bacterium]